VPPVSEHPLLVEPAVSRAKFEREVAQVRALADDLANKGCWLAKADFPEAFLVFGTPKMKPPVVAFGALFDFTNYDLWPLSVRLVDPFTRAPYKAKELPTPLPRRSQQPVVQAPGAPPVIPVQTIMQAYDPEAVKVAKGIFGTKITYARKGYDALKGADALAVVTEWHEFREPDFARMRKLLREPVIFDGRNIFEKDQMKAQGFTYYSIGR